MTRKPIVPTLALAAALSLSGCATTDTAAPMPTSTTSEGARGLDSHTLVPIPTSTPDATAAVEWAGQALTAYGRRDLAYDEWFEQLRPFLAESGVDAYATVNPSRIPLFTINGPGEAASVTDTYAVVDVATSIGRYTLELRRENASAAWGVTRIQPPE